MKLMSGGWVWELPAETEFIEIVDNGKGIRVGVKLFDANGERLDLPEADIVPDPDPWYVRVAS